MDLIAMGNRVSWIDQLVQPGTLWYQLQGEIALVSGDEL